MHTNVLDMLKARETSFLRRLELQYLNNYKALGKNLRNAISPVRPVAQKKLTHQWIQYLM